MNLRKLSASLKDTVGENGYAFVHTDGLTERQFLSIGRQFGELWNPEYEILNIRYAAAHAERSNALGRRALPAHCECAYELVPPRYVFLYCHGASRSRGMFYIVSMKEVLAHLRAADRLALRTTPFKIRSPMSGVTAERLVVAGVDGVGEVLVLLPPAPPAADAPCIAPVSRARAGKALLQRVARVACDPHLRIPHRWRRGDLAVIDNARFLHGRDGFAGRNRHLWHLRIGRFTAHPAGRGG